MRRPLVTTVVLSLLVVTGGCVGFTPDGSQPDTKSSRPVQPTTSGHLSPTPSPTATCHQYSVPHNVSLPAKPDTLTEATAKTLVAAFDRRYEVAKVKADHEERYPNKNVSVDTTGQELDVQRIDGGFEITVTTYVQVSGEDLHGKWGYPTTYRVTHRVFEREGISYECW